MSFCKCILNSPKYICKYFTPLSQSMLVSISMLFCSAWNKIDETASFIMHYLVSHYHDYNVYFSIYKI